MSLIFLTFSWQITHNFSSDVVFRIPVSIPSYIIMSNNFAWSARKSNESGSKKNRGKVTSLKLKNFSHDFRSPLFNSSVCGSILSSSSIFFKTYQSIHREKGRILNPLMLLPSTGFLDSIRMGMRSRWMKESRLVFGFVEWSGLSPAAYTQATYIYSTLYAEVVQMSGVIPLQQLLLIACLPCISAKKQQSIEQR